MSRGSITKRFTQIWRQDFTLVPPILKVQAASALPAFGGLKRLGRQTGELNVIRR